MTVQRVQLRCILLLALSLYFLKSVSFCEVIENPKWKATQLYSSLIEGKIKLPYYIPPKASSRSSSSSIYFPPPGGARPSYPQNPNYPSRNNTSIPESPQWPPSRYPQPPRDENPYPDEAAGGNNRYNHSNPSGSGTSYPSYPSYPSSPSNPSYPTSGGSNNPSRGPPQESGKFPPGPQPQPSPPGSGKYPKPSNPKNPLPSPEDSGNNPQTEGSSEDQTMETTPGKPSMAKPKPSNPSGGKNSSSPSKPTGTSSGGKLDPVNSTTLQPGDESDTDMTTESTDAAGNNSTVTCTSTKAENHKIDFPYVWKIEGFFDYARASEKFKDPFVFKLKNLNLHPEELPGNWRMTLAQQKTFFNHSTWALNITYETEDDSKAYIEVQLDAKVGRKIFVYPAVTTNHSSYRIFTNEDSDDKTVATGITMHTYMALWADIKYDKHGEFIVAASTSQDALELNFNFETVIVHKLVNSSNC
ncbi:unnamed protein product [Allacma fusca]|uniref:Uncharacterized protein n=1 Tax=Allacma fusca TaxID=39272 RepID=A0A8J2IZC0_9HEXA|nr:unnamed protein product [Allacma fusca]